MRIQTVVVDNVDLSMLYDQRKDLYEVMNSDGVTKTQRENLEGLMGLLDYICDKYEVLTYSTDGEEDECEHAYSTDGEQGICMFCGKDEETN